MERFTRLATTPVASHVENHEWYHHNVAATLSRKAGDVQTKIGHLKSEENNNEYPTEQDFERKILMEGNRDSESLKTSKDATGFLVTEELPVEGEKCKVEEPQAMNGQRYTIVLYAYPDGHLEVYEDVLRLMFGDSSNELDVFCPVLVNAKAIEPRDLPGNKLVRIEASANTEEAKEAQQSSVDQLLPFPEGRVTHRCDVRDKCVEGVVPSVRMEGVRMYGPVEDDTTKENLLLVTFEDRTPVGGSLDKARPSSLVPRALFPSGKSLQKKGQENVKQYKRSMKKFLSNSQGNICDTDTPKVRNKDDQYETAKRLDKVKQYKRSIKKFLLESQAKHCDADFQQPIEPTLESESKLEVVTTAAPKESGDHTYVAKCFKKTKKAVSKKKKTNIPVSTDTNPVTEKEIAPVQTPPKTLDQVKSPSEHCGAPLGKELPRHQSLRIALQSFKNLNE